MPLPEEIIKTIKEKDASMTVLYAASWHPYLNAENMRELVALMKSENNQHITTFTLNENAIGDEGCETLQQIQTIQHLEVAENEVSDKGAVAISHMPYLRKLEISCNDITDKGFLELVHKKGLTYLSIANNNISDAAARQVLTISDSCLTYLDLTGNNDIKPETLSAIDAWLQSNRARMTGQVEKKEELTISTGRREVSQPTFFSPRTESGVDRLRQLPEVQQIQIMLQLVESWQPSTYRSGLEQQLRSLLQSEMTLTMPSQALSSCK